MNLEDSIHLYAGDLEAQVSLIGGAILGSSWKGIPFLRGPEGAAAGDVGCFPMVPFGNRVNGNRFSFEGRSYVLRPNTPQDPYYLHGEGWQSRWSLRRKTPQSLEMLHSHDGSVLPYVYEAVQSVSVRDNALTLGLTVTNTGARAMPFGIGFHPFFPLTPSARLKFRAGPMRDELPGFLSGSPVPRPKDLEFDAAAPIPRRWINNAFEDWEGKARIEWPEMRMSLGIRADPCFRVVQLYTPGPDGQNPSQGEFFAFEPMSHLPNGQNMADLGGLVPLAPGQSISGSIMFEPAVLKSDDTPKT